MIIGERLDKTVPSMESVVIERITMRHRMIIGYSKQNHASLRWKAEILEQVTYWLFAVQSKWRYEVVYAEG